MSDGGKGKIVALTRTADGAEAVVEVPVDGPRGTPPARWLVRVSAGDVGKAAQAMAFGEPVTVSLAFSRSETTRSGGVERVEDRTRG